MKKGNGRVSRIICGILGAVLLILSVFGFVDAVKEFTAKDDNTEIEYFDAYSDDGKEHLLGFNMLSDSFATFTIGESHNLYFALDGNENGLFLYIVCMDDAQFAQYQEIYDFTFSSDGNAAVPEYGAITGYPMAIDAELRTMAIEYFNFFWDDEILTEENFSEIVGDYYLDATYQPDSSSEAMDSLLAAVIVLALGCVLLFFALRKPKAAAQSAEAAPVVPTEDYVPTPSTYETVAEIAPPLNHGLGIIGAIVGALIGGVLWIVLYRVGYIAGIAGYLAVFCALKGYRKLAGGINRAGAILSTVIAVAAIILCHSVAIAWIIADEVNKLNPGRATIGYILSNFGDMMELLELWGSFWGDLAIGLVLGIIASIGPISAATKKEKAGLTK